MKAFKAWANQYDFQRPLMVPPKTPKYRLQALRLALQETVSDPEFLAEAKKSKLVIGKATGEDIERSVEEILTITPAVRKNSWLLRRGRVQRTEQSKTTKLKDRTIMKTPLKFLGIAIAVLLITGNLFDRHGERLFCRENDSCRRWVFRRRRLRHVRSSGSTTYRKHIPGNPSLVVDNMDGAGSLIAANYTYNKADRDGTFIGVWNSAFVLYQALGDKAVRLDARKLNWIGGPIKGSPACNIMGFTGLKTMDDVCKSGESLKMGSTRAGSTYNDLPLILNQTVGTKFKVINGYKGTSADHGRHAIKGTRRRLLGLGVGEGDGQGNVGRSGRQKLIPIIIHSKWEDPELKTVPLTRDYLKSKAGQDAVALYNCLGQSV